MKRPQRILGQALSIGIPIAYMEYKHLSWEPDLNGKLRMALKQFGFWGGIAGAIYLGHSKGFRKKTLRQALPLFLGAGLLPIIGYEAMRRLAKRLFPKKSVNTPMPETSLPQQPSSSPSTIETLGSPSGAFYTTEGSTPLQGVSYYAPSTSGWYYPRYSQPYTPYSSFTGGYPLYR